MKLVEHKLKGKWVLITGASSGFGVDFANIFAESGVNLVLTARREEPMIALKYRLEDLHKIKVEVIPMDLSTKEAPVNLYNKIKSKGIQVDALVNNAGFGIYGEFMDAPWEKEEMQLMVDVVNLMHLTKLFLKDMVARNFGYLLNISSIGAYQPSPLYASYSAAKSYVLNFTEALNYELRNTNVKVSTLAPGVTATGFQETAAKGKPLSLYQRLSMMKSRPVAETGVKGMMRGTPSVMPGFFNKLSIFSLRFTPRKLMPFMVYRLMKVD
ncbi:MAG: SDR family oxidoreductase [Leptospiraceae bacterium]|nr:SDR family oxidoreductase [Leptospiraceae bacterium]